MEQGYKSYQTKTQHLMDDFYFDDEFDDDFETTKSFNDILFELERNGEILKQWEMGAPIDNALTEQKPMRNEKRTI